eukprot:8744-Heterococcus_DN1.PRE.1
MRSCHEIASFAILVLAAAVVVAAITAAIVVAATAAAVLASESDVVERTVEYVTATTLHYLRAQTCNAHTIQSNAVVSTDTLTYCTSANYTFKNVTHASVTFKRKVTADSDAPTVQRLVNG